MTIKRLRTEDVNHLQCGVYYLHIVQSYGAFMDNIRSIQTDRKAHADMTCTI